jgi:beta-glucanase (GH16 family)
MSGASFRDLNLLQSKKDQPNLHLKELELAALGLYLLIAGLIVFSTNIGLFNLGASACNTKCKGHTCSTSPPSSPSLVFADEFNSSSVDTNLWNVIYQHGETGNSEPECYLPANTNESGGYLTETVIAQTVSCPTNGSTTTSNYTSGAVQMKSFNFLYGTVEVRAKFTGGTGPWPAIWLLGHNCQLPIWLTASGCAWPNPGSDEIDIAEILGSNLTTVNEQIHSSSGSPQCLPKTTDVNQNWHVYKLVWTSGQLVFSIDGTTTCTLTGAAVPYQAMFLIINTAIGGSGGGSINNSTLPQTT